MIRICLKCGDFYADDLLAYCLVDGAPLMKVDAGSEIWGEGVRVVQEKENALRKRERKLKWRRVSVRVMTTLITTMVVCVVAVNSVIYLKPKQEEVALAEPSTPPTLNATPEVASAVTEITTPDSDTDIDADNSNSNTNTNTNTNTSTDTNTDTNTHINTNRNINTHINTNSDTNSDTNTNTHVDTNTNVSINTNTSVNVNTNTNTNTHISTNTSTNTNVNINTNTNKIIYVNTNTYITPPPPRVECSDADKSRARQHVIERYGASWQRRLEGELRRAVSARNIDARIVEVRLVAVEYEGTSFNTCAAGFVTARYFWQVRTSVREVIKDVSVTKKKTYVCGKVGGAWLCN